MIDKSKKLIFVSALALTMMTASAYGVQSVFAQETPTQSTIVQKIAEKFGLKTEDVQAVFDQEKQARQKEFEAKFEQTLTSAVAKGELTEEKKQLILAKHKEMKALRESQQDKLSTMSKEEIKAEMRTRRTEMESWAKENGIDMKYFMGGKKVMGRKHMN